MPNLEHLRKQAKLYLRWHAAGDYTVAPAIRAFLPRYRHLTDQQVLAQSFKLSDAQELVAKRAGFDNWLALRKGIPTMAAQPYPPGDDTPVLLWAEPQLFARNLKASIDFYTARLGFEVAFSYGEPAFYAQVARDGVRLNLRYLDVPALSAELREHERDLLAATITVSDVKALFLEYQGRGVEFHQRLKEEPWSARTFIVADPDGNLVMFAGSGP